MEEAKDFAYGLAEEIRNEMLAAENASADAISEDEDQPRPYDSDALQ